MTASIGVNSVTQTSGTNHAAAIAAVPTVMACRARQRSAAHPNAIDATCRRIGWIATTAPISVPEKPRRSR